MPNPPTEPSEADIIVNRSLLAYAQLRANVAAWSGLPAATLDDEEDDDEELFVAESETAGVGYIAPKDGENGRTSLNAANDKLRKQMLGKRGSDGRAETVNRGPKGRPQTSAKEDDSDDDEEGRSALLGKKRKPVTAAPKLALATESRSKKDAAVNSDSQIALTTEEPTVPSSSTKRPASYLDELLAERAKKKKKRQQRQQNKANAAPAAIGK